MYRQTSNNGLAPNRRQAIIWTNADLIHWRIYAPYGGDQLSIELVDIIDSYLVCNENKIALYTRDAFYGNKITLQWF